MIMASSGQRIVQTAPGGAIMVARPQGQQQQVLQSGQIVRTATGILVGNAPQQRFQTIPQQQPQQHQQQGQPVMRQQLPSVSSWLCSYYRYCMLKKVNN
jgi:hypothetical protein